MRVSRLGTFIVMISFLFLGSATLAKAQFYKTQALVSDQAGTARTIDPNLINAWGLSASPTGPWWVADEGTGVSTLYNGNGVTQSLIVTIPSAQGGTRKGSPTGTVFNNTTGFVITNGSVSGPASFLFVTEDGTISGWNSTVNATNAIIAVNNNASASYDGMELANNGTGNFLYVANFLGGTVDVFDSNFSKVNLSGSFTDPNLPSGYAPYNIRNLGGKLYVAYGKQNASKKGVIIGAGLGFVDTYDLNGNLLARFATMGSLNAPWGLALAPANFGTFSNDVLVGNVGDGKINAFDPNTGALLGTLSTSTGPIVIDHLWAISFGNGHMGGPTNVLYYASGPMNYAHGRFGKVVTR